LPHTWLDDWYPQVQEIIQGVIPQHWPEFAVIISDIVECVPTLPEAILPLATCKAVHGDVNKAVHVSAAVVIAAAALRTFDDALDQDRAKGLWYYTGPSRAWNYGTALEALCFNILSQSPLTKKQVNQIISHFAETFWRVASGQDRDQLGNTKTVEDYWFTIEQKSAWPYQTSCLCGALVGTKNTSLIDACGAFGYHLGLALQVLNDMESIWCTDGKTDLAQGKITLALLYGLTTNHPHQEELKFLVTSGNFANHESQIKQILDEIGTQEFLIWAALKERELALAALTGFPNHEGVETLNDYMTGLFGDIDVLLSRE